MKTLFILGGHGEIGTAIAEKFGKEGYQTVAPASNELDLRDRTSISRYLSKLNKCPEAIIHAAGINNPKLIEQNSTQDIEDTLKINILGFYQVIQYFIPKLKQRKQGHILAVSSIYGVISRPGRSVYSMSKFALNGLIKTLALELGPYNILVNSLSPGFVDTKLTSKNNSPTLIRSLEEKIPLGRLAKTEEIAAASYFLCSGENTYINGQNIIIDGGYIIGGYQK